MLPAAVARLGMEVVWSMSGVYHSLSNHVGIWPKGGWWSASARWTPEEQLHSVLTPAVLRGREEGGGRVWSQVESTSRSRNRDRPDLKPWVPTREAQKQSGMPISCTSWTCRYLLLAFFTFTGRIGKLHRPSWQHHSMLPQSGNSKTKIAKNSRKITFPFCPGMKNGVFLIPHRILVCMWECAGGWRWQEGEEKREEV